jgi:hypothetical protein
MWQGLLQKFRNVAEYPASRASNFQYQKRLDDFYQPPILTNDMQPASFGGEICSAIEN